LVPTRFGFNESKHPWMDEDLQPVSDLAENEFAKKSGKPFEGNYRAYYSLVNLERATTNYPWRPL
jgi:hypothetical protein